MNFHKVVSKSGRLWCIYPFVLFGSTSADDAILPHLSRETNILIIEWHSVLLYVENAKTRPFFTSYIYFMADIVHELWLVTFPVSNLRNGWQFYRPAILHMWMYFASTDAKVWVKVYAVQQKSVNYINVGNITIQENTFGTKEKHRKYLVCAIVENDFSCGKWKDVCQAEELFYSQHCHCKHCK